jgi:hypothetical protein
VGASTRTPAQFRDAVRSAFSTHWTAAGEDLDVVAWNNLDFNPSNRDVYVVFGLAHATGSQASLGTGVDIQIRRETILAVQILVRHNTGQAEADRLAEIVLDFVESTKLTGIRFRDQGLTEVGRSDQWFEVVVNAQIDYDSFRNV